jgi:UDPglucose--hexose-1-phosphate uridylyltransferase
MSVRVPYTRYARNPFDDEWTVYAPARAGIQSLTDGGPAAQGRDCPFCVGATEVPGDYDVLILENRYPSLSVHPTHATSPDRLDGYGRQHVFLYSSDHESRLADQPPARIARLLRELGEHTLEMFSDPRIEAVLAFENSGAIFGPSIAHPHGQVFSVPFTPKRLVERSSSCVLCSGPQDSSWTQYLVSERLSATLACMPHARLPFEMTVAPRHHVRLLAELDDDALDDMAWLVRAGLRALDAIAPGAPYMLVFYQAPRSAPTYHLRAEIVPIVKPAGGLKYLGGLELGFGVYVNPSWPEDSAETLRANVGAGLVA